ncbi:MAG: hypothetical protein AAB368_03235 [bacterium]
MGTTYSNSTTDRLEGFARARGRNVGVMISEGNAQGRYFVVNEDHEPRSPWYALGWTVAEAKGTITGMCAGAERGAKNG